MSNDDSIVCIDTNMHDVWQAIRKSSVELNCIVLISPVVVVLTLTRMIKSVVTGQAPVSLEMENTLNKNPSKPKVVHAWKNIYTMAPHDAGTHVLRVGQAAPQLVRFNT